MSGDQNHSRGRGRGRGRGSWRGGRGHRGAMSGRPPGGQRPYKKFSQIVGPRLAEADVGITEFISQHDGFMAVLKHRFSDFQVNEIDCDGKIVKLTTLDVPDEQEQIKPIERHELIPADIWEKLENLVKSKRGKTSDKGSVNCHSSDMQSEKLQSTEKESSRPKENIASNLLHSNSSTCQAPKDCTGQESTAVSQSPKEAPQSIEFDVTPLDKDSRRTIHNCVKNAFKDVNGNTVEKDGKKYVIFTLGKGSRGENRGKWPESRSGEYLHFVLNKRNVDTTEILNAITHGLRMKPNSVTFAGTKDRRAITSQAMCIRRVEPSRLYHLSKKLPNAYLGNYCFKNRPLRLGELQGNQFRIALRNVEGSDDQICAGFESLKRNGFINYYGLQRFGTNVSVPTHSIGKYLLLGDRQKAIALILEPRDGYDSMKEALNEWKVNHDAKAALKKLKVCTNSIEELLLKGLAKHGPNDAVNALSMIPLNTRLMYLHAYQSYLWNQTVSFRIRKYGLKPIIGDLVIVKSEKEISLVDIDFSSEDVALIDSVELKAEERTSQQEVKHLSEEDIRSYTIDDIVLPLPGHNIVYPNNVVGNFMLDLLKEDGLSSEKLLNQVKQYSVRGTYRRIIAKVNNLSWKIIHYNDPNADLILSDYDELKGSRPPQDIEDAKLKAVTMSMCLDLSTYATMALREITKKDTSAATQASISAASTLVSDANSKSCSNVVEGQESGMEVREGVDSNEPSPCVLVDEEPPNVSTKKDGLESPELTSARIDLGAGSLVPNSASLEGGSNESENGMKRKASSMPDEVCPEKRVKDS